ncbi:sucrose phosphorylase [Spirochaetia bacterium]|nr:sucrose phosphorylase [Spirochaetia bacterium]
MIPNKVQLITYADSLGGNLKILNTVLEKFFPGAFAGIHILPPFPSSGDRGFAPLTYFEIDPSFGDWADMAALGEKYKLLVDLMVNHISRASVPFQDFLQNGRASPYADYFLTLDKLWSDGKPRESDIDKVYLRRPMPYSTYRLADGSEERVWTTFGGTDPSEQIDLDVSSSKVRQWFTDIFTFFAKNGIGLVRIDAVGYVIKKPGTSCFLVEPEFSEFLEWIRAAACNAGIELLCEVHAETAIQNKLAGAGYWIYDFVLPYTVLHVLQTGKSELLYSMLKDRPHNQFTTLDCHDGVPVKPDLDGWIDVREARSVCTACEERGAKFTRVVSDEHKGPGGFDVHQICGTYYSLLGSDDAYIAARAIQFFVPGIPQVYYVGLLAGTNDETRRELEGEDRGLNRHNFTFTEIACACGKPVVQRLLRLIHLRNTHPAFNGEFSIDPAPENDRVFLSWRNRDAYCTLEIALGSMKTVIRHTDEFGRIAKTNI